MLLLGIVTTLAILIFLSEADSEVFIVAATSCNSAVCSKASSIIGSITADALISFLSARGVTGAAGVAGFVGVAGVVASGNFAGTDSSAINTSSVMLFFRNRK